MKIIEQTSIKHDLLGDISFVLYNPQQHLSVIHEWVTQPYAVFWGMNGYELNDTETFYARIMDNPHETTLLGFVDNKPAFLIEVYDVAHHECSEHFTVEQGDIGIHILLSPNRLSIRGFSHAVMSASMELLFDQFGAKRVIVEPDINNHKIHMLNLSVGFEHLKVIELSDKTALLGVLTADNYTHSKSFRSGLHSSTQLLNKGQLTEAFSHHLTEQHWQRANKQLVIKMITEYSHERLITPSKVSEHGYLLTDSTESVRYVFDANALPLNHLMIEPETLKKEKEADEAHQIDALAFVLEFADALGLAGDRLATYLEEITSTLSAECYKLSKPAFTADQLAHQAFQTIESEMTHGHPCFIANNGRIGFNASDYHKYTPEAATPIQIVWLAAEKSQTLFKSIDGVEYESLIESQLDLSERHFFSNTLRDRGLSPDNYYFMPVHPWQWENKFIHLFGREIASDVLVCLGSGFNKFLPQQSIRTFFNLTKPENHYVKVALSIRNMGFMRGLSAKYMEATPAINQWVYDLVRSDNTLQSLHFVPLREIATLGFSGTYFENEQLGDTPYRKMTAALWRENPTKQVASPHCLATMTSLLHLDKEGKSYLVAKIAASGLSTEKWLTAYFTAYLTPLIHCFYKYKLVFMPHGENLILKFDNHVPVGVFMKDIGEEICVLNTTENLTEEIMRVAITMPEEEELLSIFTDVFDCFFRYMMAILTDEVNFSASSFWQIIATVIRDYQASHPELNDRFSAYDIFDDDFALSCLNRLQLADNKQMVDLSDPSANLQFCGRLENPISPYRRSS
ncbi:GNAT family N-acetyltransferase [Veronia pacifica]|uniref:Acyltransferase MbtK/IucB-like conserved domain-containing protein n=1 Tax=Veronia pacifica TaxID=1080227 RepID=A0A1C3ESG8_9GAMM|nr:GNAT family N-acetyltransferase [Veronia pacifica]ODA36174.1 hypothetical protein A8L45_00800 [Veronia pacifica]